MKQKRQSINQIDILYVYLHIGVKKSGFEGSLGEGGLLFQCLSILTLSIFDTVNR